MFAGFRAGAGLVVTEVLGGAPSPSPQVGDVIFRVNGEVVSTLDELSSKVYSF